MNSSTIKVSTRFQWRFGRGAKLQPRQRGSRALILDYSLVDLGNFGGDSFGTVCFSYGPTLSSPARVRGIVQCSNNARRDGFGRSLTHVPSVLTGELPVSGYVR